MQFKFPPTDCVIAAAAATHRTQVMNTLHQNLVTSQLATNYLQNTMSCYARQDKPRWLHPKHDKKDSPKQDSPYRGKQRVSYASAEGPVGEVMMRIVFCNEPSGDAQLKKD